MSFDFNVPAGGNWPDVMIDNETMGTRPDAPIVAIGAVCFNLAMMQIGPQFYINVDLGSTMAQGAKPDASTFMWWLTQTDAARQAIATGRKEPVSDALDKFSGWLNSNAVSVTDRKVWACGTDFDVVQLAEHYHRAQKDVPWKFFNARDYRTVRELWPDLKNQRERKGHHNAVADALYQTETLLAIRQHLASKGK